MYGYIYKTTFPNGKIYIGQSHKYKEFNPKYHGSGTIVSKFLQTHDESELNTVLLEWCESKEKLDEREKYWITTLNTLLPNGYNISVGGEGGNLGDIVNKKLTVLNQSNRMHNKKHSDSTKKKISESAKNIDRSYLSNYMWITNGEINLKILKTDQMPESFWKGRTISRESTEKGIATRKNNTIKRKEQLEIEKYGSLGLSTSEKKSISGKKYFDSLSEEDKKLKYGKPMSDENKLKLSIRMKNNSYRKGKKFSDETILKMRNSAIKDNKRRKWWNNGEIETLSFDCPDGFTQGRLKRH